MTSRLALAVAVFVMLAAPALAQTPRAGGELIFLVPSEPPSDGCAGGRSGGRGGGGGRAENGGSGSWAFIPPML
jgi:hypothetical protein